MDNTNTLTCPFCGFMDDNNYQMLLHVEVYHSENDDSPFVVKDSMAASSTERPSNVPRSTRSASPEPSASADEYTDCPYKCGERIPVAELQSHTDLHIAENMALEESEVVTGIELSTGPCNDDQALRDISNSFSTSIPSPIRNYGHRSSTSASTVPKKRTASLRELFFGLSNRKLASPHTSSGKSGKIKRLGTAELGPYAHEKRMPGWLHRMLEEGAKVTISNKIGPNGTLVRVEAIANETPDLIPVLARLSVVDRTVARAFYCSPEVRHVAKMPKEGGFCGYRNIQMLVSYIRDSQSPGSEHFVGRLPSIIKLQDMIENAWDQGYNSSGRIETGGIRLTRKYIGTPEAQALLLSLGIPCEAIAHTERQGEDAYTTLMSTVFNYFEDDETRHDTHRVFITTKPPIYFQHQGHSMTIVGVEVRKNGAANLVVFDPMFNPSPSVKKLIGAATFQCSEPAKLLRAYRRGESYLSKYNEFELLKIGCYDRYKSVEAKPQ